VHSLSQAAAAIGSLNTLTVRPDGKIAADNTDWIGIRNLIEDALARREGRTDNSTLTSVVMGAGGTARAACYALQQMGIGNRYIFNRSGSKAVALGSEFGATALPSIDSGPLLSIRLDIVVSCVPGSAEITLPRSVLAAKPIVLDAAYRPRLTPLLGDARAAGCEVIEGIEMLYEQGCAQCNVWTHRPAPRSSIARGLAAFLEGQDFGPLPSRLTREL